MTPSCGNVSTAPNSGQVKECYCKDEYYFNEIAAAQNVQVTGGVTLEVSDVSAAIQDTGFKTMVRQTIADSAGTSPASIVDLTLSAGRRLGEFDETQMLDTSDFETQMLDSTAAPRILSSGNVNAAYIIVVPKAQETVVLSAMGNTTASQLSTTLSAKVQASSLTFTAEVAAKTTPAAAPATVAITTSGAVSVEGVSASGEVVTTSTAGPGTASAHTSGPTLLTIACAVVAVCFCSSRAVI
jgi:hypothetical protein